MGTTYRILVAGFPEALTDNALADGIEQRLYRLDRELMSTYAPESELSRFNRSAPGDWVSVSPELALVLDKALYFHQLTEGYFDVTVGPLVNRWGFGPLVGQRVDQARIPSDEEIAELLQQTGSQYLEVSLSPPQVRKSAQIYVDLSGIAKGYAVDVLADYFDSLEMDSYFIEVGGELRIKGLKPDGSGWVPAIEKPVDSAEPEVYQIFYSQGKTLAVAGSGDYRNYFEQDGVRYSHEIDPFNGRPISHSLAAVTVIAATAMEADALATAFMVMGEQRSYDLAQAQGLAVYFISKHPDQDGFIERFTPAFEAYLE
ncbi:MAG: FAD:protein FMN transferase, partial [Pseudohongiella sp.]|nr:FAD:protein FMN transferase [Pseudohongiella sp.]